jgi:hypothetical protein
VAEWLVWTRLVATSGGDLHVFLSLDDRGVDGIVHRISTDGFARVQVKGRSLHRYRGIEIQVRADELVDDRAVVVAVEVDLPNVQLGEYALVADVPGFRRLAHRHLDKDRDAYDAEVSLPPPAGSPWAPWCVRVDEIGNRLLPPSAAPAVGPRGDVVARKRLGYRAERRQLPQPGPEVGNGHPPLSHPPCQAVVRDLPGGRGTDSVPPALRSGAVRGGGRVCRGVPRHNDRIAELSGAEVDVVSVGPDREDTLVRRQLI